MNNDDEYRTLSRDFASALRKCLSSMKAFFICTRCYNEEGAKVWVFRASRENLREGRKLVRQENPKLTH